jgi:hypothetical protein
MAYAKVDQEEIADLLDRMDYLISLIYDLEDQTDTYRACIEGISQSFYCVSALEIFGTAIDDINEE